MRDDLHPELTMIHRESNFFNARGLEASRFSWRRFVGILLAVGWLAFGAGAPMSPGAEVRGRVTEAATEHSVAWATVTLDAQPPDGTAEYSTQTDLFGMFVLDNVAPGTYRIMATHPAYEPSVGDVSLTAEDSRSSMTFALTGEDAEVRITLHFNVSCVQTYAGLPDASITVVRWAQLPSSRTPYDDLKYVHTDAVGNHIGEAVLPGMKTGYFRFTVSRDGWEVMTLPPTGQDPVHLTTDYVVSAALEPILHDLYVFVTGFDPKLNVADQPLAGIPVEIVGLDFSETDELVEARTTLTDATGKVVFRDLPEIPWRVRAFGAGYTDAEQVARAGNAGYVPVNLSLSMRQTAVEVELHTPEYQTQPAKYARVRLTGVQDSATAGIDRDYWAVEDPDTPGRIRARFTNLIPGRYLVRIAHQRRLVPPVYPSTGYSTPDPSSGLVNERDFWFEPVRRFTEVELDHTRIVSVDLRPVPAVITGVLLAGEKPTWHGGRVFLEKKQKGIEFVQPGTEPILASDAAVQSVNTDDAGHFTIELPPGVYGVRIPGLDDYTAYNMTLIDPDTGDPIIDPFTQKADRGWPYPETDGTNFGPSSQFAGPLFLGSGDRYSMVLRVHKKQATVVVPLYGLRSPLYETVIGWDPNSGVTTADVVELKGTTTLTRIGGGLPVVHKYTPEEGFEEPGTVSFYAAFFPDVPPGVYDIDVQLDHFAPAHSTVTVPLWGDPGYLPTDPLLQSGLTWVDPGETIGPENDVNFTKLQLTTLSPGLIELRVFDWVDAAGGNPGYYNAPYFPKEIAYVKRGHNDADGNRFYLDGFNGYNVYNSTSGAPDGEYTLWWPSGNNKWFRAEAGAGQTSFDVYKGGPQNNVTESALPPFRTGDAFKYEVRVSTVSTGDSNYCIGGITIDLPSGSSPAQMVSSSSGPTTVHFAAAPATDSFSGVQSTQWLHYGADTWTLVSVDPVVFDVLVHFKRGMQVSGHIAADSAGRGGIAHAHITVYDRRGTQLLTGVSDDQGQFTVGPVDTQAVYVEVRAPGYLPFRKRYSPGPADSPDIATGDIALTPVPAPVIQSLTLDRFGLFLPGVLKSGDASGYNVNNADSALTATWRAEIQAATLSFSLEGFDDDQGAPQHQAYSFPDPVRSVWLVDKRRYGSLPSEDPLATPNPLSAPSPLTGRTVEDLIADIAATQKDSVPFYVVYSVGTPDSARNGRDTENFQGTLKLYNLPPGRFLPMLLVVTRYGAATASDYLLPDARTSKKPLQGLKLPKWSSTFLETIGVASTFAPDVDPSKVTPAGRFVPLPDFDSGIDVNPHGYLTYTYQLGLAWSEGVKAPTSGILSAASKNLGLSFKANARFQVTGEDAKTELTVGGAVTKDSKEAFEKYYPAFAKAAGFTVHSASVTGAGRLGVAEFIDGAAKDVPDYTYTSHASAFVKARFYRDMTQFLEKLPTVGPVLGGLGRSGTLVVNGVVDLGIGGGVTITSSTFYPDPVHAGTVLPGLTQPARWHILGGMGDAAQEVVDPAKFNLQLLVGAGVNVSMFGDRLSGTATVQLGPPKDIPNQKGLKFTVNPHLEWPLITRVQGAFNVLAEFALRLWGVKVSRSFNLFDRRIDWQLAAGSGRAGEVQPYYDLVPLYTAEIIQRPGLSPPPVLHGSGPVLLEGLDGPGLFDIARDGSILAYVGSAPGANGTVQVLAAPKAADGSWQSPDVLAQAAAVLGVAVAPRPEGGYLVVWTELAPDQVGNPFPETSVRYTVSDVGRSTWSAPATLTTVQAAAWGPRLVPAGDGLLLTWLNTTGGPLTSRHLGMSAFWTGGAWTVGPLPVQPAETDIADLAVAGTADPTLGNPALFAWSDGQGNIFAQHWTGSGWTLQTLAATDAVKQVAAAFPSSGGGDPVLAYVTNRDSLAFATLTGTRDTTPLAEISNVSAVEDLALRATSADTYTAVWSRGGGTHSAVFFAIIGVDGTVLAGPLRASADGPGRLGNIRIEPGAGRGGDTVVVEVLANGQASLLRYPLDPATPATDGPVILEQPHDMVVTRGATARIELTASGIGSISIDWLHDDQQVDNPGNNKAHLDIVNVQTEDEGDYKAVVSDATGLATSDPATLTATDSFVFQLEPGWNLLGLPAVPDHLLTDILKDADGTPLTDGPVWAWDAAAQTYTALPTDAPPPAGIGFWVFSRYGGATILFDPSVRGAAASNARSLAPGWNLLSPPATGTLPETWPPAEDVWKWDGKRYAPVDSSAPVPVSLLTAYWVYRTP